MAKKYNVNQEMWDLFGGTPFGQALFNEPSETGAGEGGIDPGFQAFIDAWNKSTADAAASDDAALNLQAELARAGLDIQQGQLGVQQGQLALAQEAQAFTEEDIRNQRLLEAAGLATGPAGAIQLAYMARGKGAPQEEVASIFQNLPFVQELLHGQNVPGFGLPEQLGGESPRTDEELTRTVSGGAPGAIAGKGLGVTIPGKKSITQQAFGTLSGFEQEFLGALGQSETGQSSAGFLEDIIKSFIPTRAAGPVSIA